MAEDQVLGDEAGPVPERSAEHSEQEGEDLEHGPGIMSPGRRKRPGRILRPHTTASQARPIVPSMH